VTALRHLSTRPLCKRPSNQGVHTLAWYTATKLFGITTWCHAYLFEVSEQECVAASMEVLIQQ
jgi:hypothetical protein